MIFKKTLIIVTLSFITSLANAKTNVADSSNNSNLYFGLKAGQLTIDEEDTKSIDDPMIYGGFMGYQFNDKFGVEVDYLVSSEEKVTTKLGSEGKYEIASYGSYLTYRYPFADSNLYAKSKFGFAGAEVKTNYIGASTSNDDVGIAGGLGLGYRFSKNVSFEGEFNMLRSDIIDTNSFTFGTRLQF